MSSVEDVISAKGPKCGQYKSAAAFLLSLSALSLKKKDGCCPDTFWLQIHARYGPVMDIRYPMQARKVQTRTQNGFWQRQNVSGHHEMHLGWGKWAASGGEKKKQTVLLNCLQLGPLADLPSSSNILFFYLLVEKVNSHSLRLSLPSCA